MRRAAALVLAAALLNAPGALAEDLPAPHRVDVAKRFQTIDHFGASDCWTTKILGSWSPAARERVADLLFSREKGIGLSLWRFNIGAGSQPERIKEPLRTTPTFETGPGKYDWTRMPTERWMLRAAKERGVPRFHAFALSGTPRMTRNGFVNADPGANTVNLKTDAEDDYARYLVDVVEHFARGVPESERVAFDWISPFNEPEWEWNGGAQEGTRASNADIVRVAGLLDAALRKRRLTTRVHLAESGSIPDMTAPNADMTARYKTPFGNYVDAFCGDPAVRDLLDKTIGYHAYWSDGGDVFGRHRLALRAKLDAYPGWRVFQTEYCIMQARRDLGMDSALHLARVLHGDLAIVNASGWSWWLALSPHDYKDGLLYTDWKAAGDPETVIPSKMFWAFGNHSRFVRPGMVRVAIDGVPQDHAGLLATAYHDAAGGRVVVVYVNSGRTPVPVRVEIARDSPHPKSQRAYVTSGAPGDDLRALDATPAGSTVTIPARAIVTVVLE
jgi:O-glycosyl hydrolase